MLALGRPPGESLLHLRGELPIKRAESMNRANEPLDRRRGFAAVEALRLHDAGGQQG